MRDRADRGTVSGDTVRAGEPWGGKTTLAVVLLRFLDPAAGRVLLGETGMVPPGSVDNHIHLPSFSDSSGLARVVQVN
jgi:hypothetical protein